MAWAAPGVAMTDGPRVMAQRIAENGTLQGNAIEVKSLGMKALPIRILPHVDIAYNGTSYGFAWVSNEVDPLGFEVDMARFNASMQKIGSDVQVTSLGPRDSSNVYEAGNYPRLVWNGDEYAVTWHDLLGMPRTWNAYMRTACY